MVLLRDGSIATLDATARPSARFGGQRRLDTALADLRNWLRS